MKTLNYQTEERSFSCTRVYLNNQTSNSSPVFCVHTINFPSSPPSPLHLLLPLFFCLLLSPPQYIFPLLPLSLFLFILICFCVGIFHNILLPNVSLSLPSPSPFFSK
uniref:Uncharacterized protein n=1 Tax=Cacopsylla melanoneura TaxID=428564 RepID=A0A8D9FCP0_9HEMI